MIDNKCCGACDNDLLMFALESTTRKEMVTKQIIVKQ